MKWMAKTLAALMLLATTWTSVGNAAKSLEEGYCSVGAIFSLNIPNAIYMVSDPTLATLYEKEDGTFGIRCIKPGDVYITAIAKLDGGLYKFTYLAHITGEDTGEAQMSPRHEASTTEFAHEVVRLVNEERAKVGARPLRMASDLQQAAGIRAQEIVRHFSHTRPDGPPGWQFMLYCPAGRLLSAGWREHRRRAAIPGSSRGGLDEFPRAQGEYLEPGISGDWCRIL